MTFHTLGVERLTKDELTSERSEVMHYQNTIYIHSINFKGRLAYFRAAVVIRNTYQDIIRILCRCTLYSVKIHLSI